MGKACPPQEMFECEQRRGPSTRGLGVPEQPRAGQSDRANIIPTRPSIVEAKHRRNWAPEIAGCQRALGGGWISMGLWST